MNYQELINLVTAHSRLYYEVNRPTISDEEFDKLYDLLLKIEEKQGWADSNSPTLKVGHGKGKIKHPYKLYSLKKVYDANEIPAEFTVKTPKIDGANLTLVYRKGRLDLALVRGNGEHGDSVTHVAQHISNIPKTISQVEDVVVNGECVTENDVTNFRNYVAGALNLKSEEEFKTRNIKFIAHDWLGVQVDYLARMRILQKFGFQTVIDTQGLDKYPHDGVVYRLDSAIECAKLGYTSKHPRFALALKTREALTAISVLNEVIWVVGRTGSVNPVGLIEPVEIDGATVSRVTLHNLDIILYHKLGLGDIIEVERAGGVIPKLCRVIEHAKHNHKITQEHAEIFVGEKLTKIGPKLFSDHKNGSKILEHFIKTMKIKGLGPRSIEKLGLTHPLDLYQNVKWETLGANGAKVAEEVERSKTKPYSTVLAALGINNVGETLARKIINVIPTFQRLRDIEYKKIEGVGDIIANNILSWLDLNEDWVLQLPLQLEANIEAAVTSVKLNKKICITGKLDMSREELSSHLETLGYTVTSSVTKDCYALITDGPSSSTKYLKAQDLGISILNYWENKKEILKGSF